MPRRWPWDADAPTAFIVRNGEQWPFPNAHSEYDRVAGRDVEFIRKGMPTGVALYAWLPEKREQWVSGQAAKFAQIFGLAAGSRTADEERAKEIWCRA